ncbi:MAG TPA: two-component system sensor histidine kinase CpxA, partial [Pasteurellaceae bacterium]|nr:two-component system sensor histidine kinase CpxA [Pasteurellaceae bacterium]
VFYDIQVVGPFSVHIDSDFESGQRETYLLYFVKYVNPQREVVNFIFDHPLSIVFIIMMITSPLLWWLVWSISEPIKRLQSAANAVALGNFDIDKNLEAHGASELRQVGRSFNRMAQAISELISSHQSLLSSISHELRTPLTRLQLATALLRRRYGNGGEILRIENEAERLNKMINDLLQLSRKQIKNQLLREPFPIDEIWETIMKDARFEASQMNIKCSFKQNIINPGQHRMSGNQEALSSAVENILRNALKYTNTQIEIITYLGNGYLFISVDDDGAGVSPAEYDEIFKPFYRVDTARTRETGGAGLGLTIVQDVVQQHRGRVWAESSPLGGLRVTIQLPLWR